MTWATALPRPVAFVLSGGASLGAVQVGMLRALAEVGLEPDLIVGTSVGSLNGAVVADHAVLSDAVDTLERTWHHIARRQVFPGGAVAQALSVLRTGYLHPQDGLARVIDRTLRARTFAELSHSLIIVTPQDR